MTLLTLQTHIQLNLLGRSTYVASVISSTPLGSSLESSQTIEVQQDDDDLENGEGANERVSRAGEISPETERMYLTFSWWLLHEGWKQVAERVQDAVEEVIGP